MVFSARIAPCQGALRTADPNEAILLAAVDISCVARCTRAIVDDGLHANPVAHLELSHIVSNLLDDAAEFMANGEWNHLFCYGVRSVWHEPGLSSSISVFAV